MSSDSTGSATAEPSKPPVAVAKILIVNQYYVPDVASTGHLLHELAVELAKQGREVHVVTCFPCYGPKETWQACPARESSEGVSVRRIRTTRFSKDNLLGRLVNSITFLLPLALRQLIGSRSADICIYTSNPPYLGVIGGLVSLIRRHPYLVLLHDSYPHLAVWVGKIRAGGLIERVWHAINRLTYRRALGTIVLCERARDLVCREYGVPPESVHVIPNWADPGAITPVPKKETSFARKLRLLDDFTVIYSGNLGLYYDFSTVLDAAELLRGERVRFVLIGAGGQQAELAAAIRNRGLGNVSMHPYQPYETINDSLNACDASLVSIARGIEGISFPSKFYSSLAVGKPVIAISEANSELREVIDREACGVWCEVGDGPRLAELIRGLAADPARAASMGANARALLERDYTMETCARRYLEVVDHSVDPTP